MKKRFILSLLLVVLLLSACNNEDELSGKTFEVAYTPVLQDDLDSPNRYDSIMTLEFLDGNVVNNTFYGEGTYELIDDVLELHFENENENLKIKFTVKESDKDFSEYSAEIRDVDFEMIDTDKISDFKNLTVRLIKDMPIEILKE
ncbi:hypothetical protein [Oceanobacillus bengalensis]|uniref:Uncharacterized protein n=1 Tax=Oceanobacillus bengalensis TaxID=1435466 RepID=A0A494Z411_9BACI|nr:hypothetical protein [Oceanobacillus bengalensis]RKQ17181.1 hypothetical protein D8M05_05825 [Oceanobacillus bengalensis]